MVIFNTARGPKQYKHLRFIRLCPYSLLPKMLWAKIPSWFFFFKLHVSISQLRWNSHQKQWLTQHVPLAAGICGSLSSESLIYLFYCRKWESDTCLHLMHSCLFCLWSGASDRLSVQGLQEEWRVILVQTGTGEVGHSQTGTPVWDKVKGNTSYKGM